MYKVLFLLHIIASSVFIGVAIAITVRSVAGWLKGMIYSKTDTYLRKLFIGLLYFTLVNGIIMYFIIDPVSKSDIDIQNAIKRASLRFWVVEHFYFMTFALILAQIGGIFIRKSKTDKSRFGYAGFYYGSATAITLISMLFYFIYR